MRILIPAILLAAAVGLFALATNPTYQRIKVLQAKQASFDEALNKAKEIKAERDRLLSKRGAFLVENMQKLERILPDNVDNIRFVIEINNIAARHNLTLKNVGLGTISDSKAARSELAVGASGDAVGSAEISFSVTAGYQDFLAFLRDLEHSLRLVDVESIDFAVGEEGDTYEFKMTIRTYWLH